ncbi:MULTISPECIES: hypothetical protein [unclassified Rhizobium]|uniref:hypothetical protein n=1 Tax=unclassified Rhizobium TaxID=2613769 RepID=UPI001ADD1764|nr:MULTISPECIES: hypothetical protein [unclassified Rhizobium]MBO9126457.1 hypothetical protein [Rhizobium sp. 16-488-2b]MBO9178392.1 hypothetical protein [Rhizobium sp. 16-488-2a]MBO9194937.1 hypothetical protein [Rhizobium sp. 16-449-1b]
MLKFAKGVELVIDACPELVEQPIFAHHIDDVVELVYLFAFDFLPVGFVDVRDAFAIEILRAVDDLAQRGLEWPRPAPSRAYSSRRRHYGHRASAERQRCKQGCPQP